MIRQERITKIDSLKH